MKAASYNVGNTTSGDRVMIAMRAIPGTRSETPLYGAAGEIGIDPFDSYSVNDIYIIRRSCQTLPCFVIHF